MSGLPTLACALFLGMICAPCRVRSVHVCAFAARLMADIAHVVPERPTCPDERFNGPALPGGRAHLPALARALLRRLSESQQEALTAWLRTNPVLDYATICSGTESPRLVMDAIKQAIASELKCEWDTEHLYACDVDKRRRSSIDHIFPDTDRRF